MDMGRTCRKKEGWEMEHCHYTEWSPQEGKRNRGRQRKRLRDEIQNFCDKTNWYADAREREQCWRHHAEAFVQQWTDNG